MKKLLSLKYNNYEFNWQGYFANFVLRFSKNENFFFKYLKHFEIIQIPLTEMNLPNWISKHKFNEQITRKQNGFSHLLN